MTNINPNGTDIEPDGPDDDDIIDMAWKVANAQGVLPIDDVSINSHLLNKVIEIAKETVELRDTLLQREERLTFDPKIQALLADVERHDKAAQAGPWYYVHGYGFNVHSLWRGDGERTPDVDFVCFARTALPQLAAAVWALAKDGERLDRFETRIRKGQAFSLSWYGRQKSAWDEPVQYDIPAGFFWSDEANPEPTLRAAIDAAITAEASNA